MNRLTTALKKLLAITAALGVVDAHAEIAINWSNADPSIMRDSTGEILLSAYPAPPGTGNFYIELGTFDSFAPTTTNYADWSSNWRTFDLAAFNQVTGAFASEVFLEDDGTSSSSFTSGGSFFGQDVWIWIYNQKNPEPLVSEWFLGRVNAWKFPADTFSSCCGGNLPDQFSLNSDWDNAPVDSVTVIWGAHSSRLYEGGGVYDVDPNGNFLIQTYTIIPEPGTWVMMGIFGLTALSILRFRRKGVRS